MAVWSSFKNIWKLNTGRIAIASFKKGAVGKGLNYIPVRNSHERTLTIKTSPFFYQRVFNLIHLYVWIGIIPIVAVVTYVNLFIGPATLALIPEGYEPKHWEYYRHPITRFLAWLLPSNQEIYERNLHHVFFNNEILLMRDLRYKIRTLMGERQDYQAWFFTAPPVKYIKQQAEDHKKDMELREFRGYWVYPKEIWEIESGCGEEVNTSGNESEGENNILFADPSDLPEEVLENRRQVNLRKKNVRFGSSDFNYVLDTSETSSVENEYLDIDCGFLESGRRKSLSQDPEIISHKQRDHFRLVHKTKCRNLDCGFDKITPKSNPEKVAGFLESAEKRPPPVGLGEYDIHRMRRKDYCCGRHYCEDFNELMYRKPIHRSFKYECGGDASSRCCDCSVHCTDRKNYMKKHPSHKHICHLMKDPELEVKNHRKLRLDSHYDPQTSYHAGADRYCGDEYFDHAYSTKPKKKTLEAVQEQQEQFSDSTYKVACNKFSSQTVPGELSAFPKKRSSEKLTNSSLSDWLYYSAKGHTSSLGEKLGPPRIHKMRSRRTRMNKIKNGWKRVLVQTVRDGSRNERVGVIVMGPKGPEFYSNHTKKSSGFVPFRKSKSFLDGAAKSFEVMTVDCKNVFLSSSEPGPRTNYAINDLVCPEDDDKVEEKIARFSKNVNEIVKNSEEKFYKALSCSEYPENKKLTDGIFKGAGEGLQEEEKKEEDKKDETQKSKYSPFHMLSLDNLSPKLSKSLRKPEKTTEDSTLIGDTLNEQAKQYLENQSNLKDKEETFLEELKELQEKYPPKGISQEVAETNLSLWGMKLDRLSEKTETKEQNELEEISSKKDDEEKMEEKEKMGKDELSQTGSVKSTEQISINKQRRKKYFESTAAGGKFDDEGDAHSSKPQSNSATPKRISKVKKWELTNETLEKQNTSREGDSNRMSSVFRGLIEGGRGMSEEESANLQNILNKVSYTPEPYNNEVMSSSSSDVMNTIRESKINVSPRTPKTPTSVDEMKDSRPIEKEEKKGKTKRYFKEERKENNGGKKKGSGESEGFPEEVSTKKVLKTKNSLGGGVLDPKIFKIDGKQKEGKTRRKADLEDKMKLLRQALPSIAAKNEAAHLKQLKKYIDRFIDRVEASTASEFSKRKESRLKCKESASTDSSEVRVDARKILDFVSNPFKKISSDVTINIAKKLTDALVQDKSTKCPRNYPTSTKARKHSEAESDDDGFPPCDASSGSERYEEPEPTYLKQLKKMRNEHLNNIVLEVRRLSELLRFLDRCNRLHF